MGELLAIGLFGLACYVVGMLWGVRVGRLAECQSWLSASGDVDAGNHIRRRGTDWVVLSMDRCSFEGWGRWSKRRGG